MTDEAYEFQKLLMRGEVELPLIIYGDKSKPRVPAGSPKGGQWTSLGFSSGGGASSKEGKMSGTRQVAQRMVNVEDRFIDSVREQFGFSKQQALKILGTFKKLKLVKIDAVGGQFKMKDGRFWDKEVMMRATQSGG